MKGATVCIVATMLQLATGQTLKALYDSQVTADANLYATAVMSVVDGATQYTNGATAAMGNRDLGTPTRPMELDTAARIGSLAELIVVAAALTSATGIAGALDTQVPSKYIPGTNLNLLNPAHRTTPITYRMLMQHTSTLTDDLYFGAQLSQGVTCTTAGACTGGGTTTFTQFMENTFTAASVGSTDLTSAIFTTLTPGQPASYNYAHTNTALLVYILNRMVIDGDITVTSTDTNRAAAYIFENVVQPLGMSNSFYLLLSGNIPQRGNEALSALLQSMLFDYEGTTRRWMTHPNIWADVMGYSTVGDLQKLAGGLLSPATSECTAGATTLCAIGKLMKETTITPTANTRRFQTLQGLGVQFFNPVSICSATVAKQVFTTCPLTAENTVWGHVTGGTGTDLTTIAGVLCVGTTGAVGKASCTSIVQGFKKTGTALSSASAFEMIGAAFQLAFGQTAVVSTGGNSTSDDLYGLWVILGVAGTVVFVLAASYFTEFLIQPPPPVGPGPAPFNGQQPPAEQFHPPPPQF